jgi:hypothetical protein
MVLGYDRLITAVDNCFILKTAYTMLQMHKIGRAFCWNPEKKSFDIFDSRFA